MINHHSDIRIGTLAQAFHGADYLRQILPHGFESIQLTFRRNMQGIDLTRLATEVGAVLAEFDNRVEISCLGYYGNALIDNEAIAAWEKLIDSCELFNCRLVCGFAGRLVNRPVPESIPRFKAVFSELAKRAEDRGVRLAFENCDMGGTWDYGDWNIAHSPHAWELMFDAVTNPNLGLEWEPCHQLNSLVDPLPQLRKWVHRIFHIHGKDATILHDVIQDYGIRGGKAYCFHRTPGFGDTNWTDVISILRMGGYHGAIDIEGWHDPVYREDMEMTGQVHALHYLKNCRGGDYIPNPGPRG